MVKRILFALALAVTIALFAPSTTAPVAARQDAWPCEDTHTAANATYATVNTLVQSATVDDGDCVNVPAGVVTWSSTLTITNKSIQLIGAGVGSTVITNGSSSGTILWNTEETCTAPCGTLGGFARVSGFTFSSSASSSVYMVRFVGSSPSVRVDNSHFNLDHTGGIWSYENNRGVIDNNTFDMTIASFAVKLNHDAWEGVNDGSYGGTAGSGGQSWNSDSTIGTSNQWVVEDNTWTAPCDNNPYYFTDDEGGARITYRFNTLTCGIFADHGTDTAGRQRSPRHWEFYGNTWATLDPDTAWPSVIGRRGGTGMVFDNTVPADTIQGGLHDVVYYRYQDTREFNVYGRCSTQSVTSITRSGSTATATVANHGVNANGSHVTIAGATQSAYNGTYWAHYATNGSFTFTVVGTPATPATGTITTFSPVDGNADSSGYRCIDQIGAGRGDTLITGGCDEGASFECVLDNPINTHQVLQPAYAWNNLEGSTISPTFNQEPGVITENRDIYTQRTGTFNGTGASGDGGGVGRGLRSARPSTCTAGVAYWATDGGTNWNTANGTGVDGGLDRCVSTNTWTNNFYVPLAYPHPLVSGIAVEECDCEEEPDLPPTLTIAAPAATTETILSALTTLTGTCTDDGTVVVTWENDQGGSGTASGTANWTIPTVALTTEAINVITVTCTDDATVAQTDTDAVSVMRVTVPGTPVDTFTRGTWATLGPNWTLQSPLQLSTTGGTAVSPVDTTFQCSFWNAHTLTANQFSEAAIIGTISSTRRNRVTVRAGGTTQATFDYYGVVAATSSSALIVRVIDGVQTTLQTINFMTWASGDLLRLEVVGDTLRAYKNGAQIGTDQAAGGSLSSGAPGICGSNLAAMDTFTAGLTSAVENPVGIPHPRWRMRRGGNSN
jgi:hypothetical protein